MVAAGARESNGEPPVWRAARHVGGAKYSMKCILGAFPKNIIFFHIIILFLHQQSDVGGRCA